MSFLIGADVSLGLYWSAVTPCCSFLVGEYAAPRAVLTGHDHEVVCVSVCAELGLVISGAKGQKPFLPYSSSGQVSIL